MHRFSATLFLTILASFGFCQFVVPRSEDHVHEKSLYVEDPFITQYRHRFFAVFQGDFATFRKAYLEIASMVAKNPNDARALVWLGNGQTVDAALHFGKGKQKDADDLLKLSRRNLDAAVALRPNDPNIFMMRAATLYVQGMYWPSTTLPRSVWETLRDDCQHFITLLGPDKIARVSVHVRGEAYGELGIAYLHLGERDKAADAFRNVARLCPNSAYEERARKELLKLKA
jgi:lipoprotein NlpI